MCPTRYRTRHFFNNSNTNEDIATKFEQEFVRCVRNEEECVCGVCLFRCNILFSGKIIKVMSGSVASGTHSTLIEIPLLYNSQVSLCALFYLLFCAWSFSLLKGVVYKKEISELALAIQNASKWDCCTFVRLVTLTLRFWLLLWDYVN